MTGNRATLLGLSVAVFLAGAKTLWAAEPSPTEPSPVEPSVAGPDETTNVADDAVSATVPSEDTDGPIEAPNGEEGQAPVISASEKVEDVEADEGLGLTFELEIASSYMFRGQNLYKSGDSDPQRQQVLRISPAITWAIGETNLSVGYWGALQATGAIADNIRLGSGAEQDFWLSYELPLAEDVSVSATFNSYLYPFANGSADWAGTTMPVYLEPCLGVVYSGIVDLGLKVSYMAGIQSEISDGNYVYWNPTIARQLEVLPKVTLDGLVSFGYKQYVLEDLEDSRYDVLFTLAAPIDATEAMYVKPSASFSWTNLVERRFADEYAVWVAVNVGTHF